MTKNLKLQKQPNAWTCLATSFAMILDIPVEELIKGLKHDGSKRFWEDLAFPWDRQGHHQQELIDYCWDKGYCVTIIDAKPLFEHFHPDAKINVQGYLSDSGYEKRIRKYLVDNCAVLTGELGDAAGHAVAWDGRKIYDPRGDIKDIDSFKLHQMFIISLRKDV